MPFLREIYQAQAYTALTVNTTVISLPSSSVNPTGAKIIGILITAQGGTVSYTINGTTPTTTIGHQILAGDVLEIWESNNVKKFAAVRQGATNGTLKVTLFGA